MLSSVRKIDELGRIVIPKEMRVKMNVEERVPGEKDGTSLLVRYENNEIIITKREDNCRFCSSHDNLIEIEGITICKKCAEKIYRNISKYGI